MNYAYSPQQKVDKQNPETLNKILLQSCKGHEDEYSTDFISTILCISTCCKLINQNLRQAGIDNLYGYSDEQGTNSSGEVQKKIDVIANDIMKKNLFNQKTVSLIASEEEKDCVVSESKGGRFIIAFDPLDGSSNIDCNVTTGTIFGIWKRINDEPNASDFYQKGREMVAAGYCIYGTCTQFVLSFNNEVNWFTLDTNIGEFILTHPGLKIKEKFNIYSVNEGNSIKWTEPFRQYIQSIKVPTAKGVSPYSLRYIGSMVADVHRTLLYGGVFLYPADKSCPKGKLRLLYECAPMSYIIETAGGRGIDGVTNILDIVPNDIHQRTPIIIGSKIDVDEVEYFYQTVPDRTNA